MTGSSHSKGAIFLIEFLIMLLVFSLACVVALRLFAKADELEKRTADADCATAAALSLSAIVEEYYAGGELPALVMRDGDSFTACFDNESALCLQSDAVYTAKAPLTASENAGGLLIDGVISVYARDLTEAVYTLPLCEFYAKGAA